MNLIHLAQFGNKSNAHSVLGHSGLDQGLLTSLLFRSDAPPESSGLGLEPFLSAYRHDNWYIVQATRLDPSAPRPGMVTTDAAIVPLGAVAKLDISALWHALRATGLSVDSALHVESFIEQPGPASGHTHAPGAGNVGAALLVSTRRAIWTGSGLEECVACLWLHLRFEDRIRLVIGAAAHPGRIAVPISPDSMTIIATAHSVANRWSAWPMSSTAAVQSPDAARDAMFGDDEGRSDDLAHRLELSYVRSWSRLASAAALLEKLAELDHEECRALVQLLGFLQPDLARGVEVKSVSLIRLADLTATASFADIWGLLGLPWQAVSASGTHAFLRLWAHAVMSDSGRAGDVLDAIIRLRAAGPDQFAEELRSCLAAEVHSVALDALAASSLTDARGGDLLLWLVETELSLAQIDAVFAKAAHDADRPPGWLISRARRLGLPRTHAVAVDVSDPVAAWSDQTKIRPRSDIAEDVLEGRSGPAGVVTAALALTDRKLKTRAAKAVMADSALLDGGSVVDAHFRAVWFEAVTLGADPWGPVEPSSAVDPLLDLLLAGESVEPAVLTSLSRTTAADISNYPSRSLVWTLLPDDAAAGFKSATAAALARSYKHGAPAPEQPLQAAMLATPLLESVSRESATQAINLLYGMSSAQARDAVVVATNGCFSRTEENRLASLVVSRRWRAAADAIIGLSASRTDLHTAANHVSSLLGFWDRLGLLVKGGVALSPNVSKFDLRTGVEEMAATLYPDGPKSDRVWERAGGDEADLLAAKTGRLTWGHAIQGAMDGRRGMPAPIDLIEVMLEDFPRNEKLQALKSLMKKEAN